MKSMIEIVYDSTGSASHHMEVDRALIMTGNSCPRLRIYRWAGFSITAGLFVDPAQLLDLDQCRRMNVEIAKRPTGGGVLFHGSDLAVSFFVPGQKLQGSVEEWCHQINERLIQAVCPFFPKEQMDEVVRSKERCRFCMSQVTGFDLLWGGKKIGGCAMRKTRAGILHQTSLFLTAPDWKRIAMCVTDAEDVGRMQQMSTSFDRLTVRKVPLDEVQEAIVNNFLQWNSI